MLKIVLVETVKHYWFLKIFILEYIRLNILWDELWNIHKIILLCNKVLWQSLFLDCVIIWVPSQIPFLLKSTTDRQTSITFMDIFPKTNQVSLSLQEKQLIIYVVNDQIWLLKRKWELWKTCILHCEIDSFPTFKAFLRSVMILTNVNFLNCIVMCVSIWKTCITQWTNIFFQMNIVWCYKIMHKLKSTHG